MQHKLLYLALTAAGLTLVTPAHAAPQEPPAAPTALPGDAPLPPLNIQLHLSLGPPPGPRTTPAPAAPPSSIPLAVAAEGAQRAIQACAADGYAIGAAVTDAAGQLRAGLAADGAQPGRVYVAVRKDLTSVAFDLPSKQVRAKLLADPSMQTQIKPNMAAFSGAIPLRMHGIIAGAIASSGSTGNEDEKCAQAGAAYIQSRLD